MKYFSIDEYDGFLDRALPDAEKMKCPCCGAVEWSVCSSHSQGFELLDTRPVRYTRCDRCGFVVLRDINLLTSLMEGERCQDCERLNGAPSTSSECEELSVPEAFRQLLRALAEWFRSLR